MSFGASIRAATTGHSCSSSIAPFKMRLISKLNLIAIAVILTLSSRLSSSQTNPSAAPSPPPPPPILPFIAVFFDNATKVRFFSISYSFYLRDASVRALNGRAKCSQLSLSFALFFIFSLHIFCHSLSSVSYIHIFRRGVCLGSSVPSTPQPPLPTATITLSFTTPLPWTPINPTLGRNKS